MGDSWDILHRWEPFSRDSDPDEPSPLSETTVEQLKACVAQGLSHNLAHFCSSSVPQGGLSLHWLSRCHPCPPPHTHALWLGQTPPPWTCVSLCVTLPPPHHNLQFCCQLVEEKPHHLLFLPSNNQLLSSSVSQEFEQGSCSWGLVPTMPGGLVQAPRCDWGPFMWPCPLAQVVPSCD